MHSDIGDFVRATIASYLRIPVGDVAPQRTLQELGVDSLGALELLLTCEEHYGFGLTLDGNDTEIVTVADAVADIARRVELSAAADDGIAS